MRLTNSQIYSDPAQAQKIVEDNYKLAKELHKREQELIEKQKRADELFEQELARSQNNDEFAKGA